MSTELDQHNTIASGGIIFFIVITLLAIVCRVMDLLPDVVVNIILIFIGIAILCVGRYVFWRSESNNGTR